MDFLTEANKLGLEALEFTPNGGESISELVERVKKFLNILLK